MGIISRYLRTRLGVSPMKKFRLWNSYATTAVTCFTTNSRVRYDIIVVCEKKNKCVLNNNSMEMKKIN